LDRKKLRAQIDGDGFVPIFRRDFFDGVALVIGGVVDQDVDGTEGVEDLLDRGLKSGDVAKVAGKVKRSWTALGDEVVDEPMRRFVLNVEEGDTGTLMRKMADKGFADTGGAAGDEDCAVAEARVSCELIRELGAGLWLRLVRGVVRHR